MRYFIIGIAAAIFAKLLKIEAYSTDWWIFVIGYVSSVTFSINFSNITKWYEKIRYSKHKYNELDIKQVDNHLYIDGEEVREIKFKNNTRKTIGQLIKIK